MAAALEAALPSKRSSSGNGKAQSAPGQRATHGARGKTLHI